MLLSINFILSNCHQPHAHQTAETSNNVSGAETVSKNISGMLGIDV